MLKRTSAKNYYNVTGISPVMKGMKVMPESKKQVEELTFINDLYYHKEHTWAKVEGDLVRVGITDYAQDQLGDIIFIELPAVGETFDKDEVFGSAESAKTVSSLYIPVSGTIEFVNDELADSPELVNKDPYGDGWMIVVKPRDMSEVKDLLSKDEYISMLKECENE